MKTSFQPLKHSDIKCFWDHADPEALASSATAAHVPSEDSEPPHDAGLEIQQLEPLFRPVKCVTDCRKGHR